VEAGSAPLSPVPGVELVPWPSGEQLRRSLARAGVPRLLLLADGEAPPDTVAFDEDWIREPCGSDDLRARATRVLDAVRAQSEAAAWIDDHRVLHHGHRTAVLTASEAVVAATLLASKGEVVTRGQLEGRLWPGSRPPSARAVDAIVYRLRRRCDDLGLLIRSARGRGFVLVSAS
jgi:DNA-binding response OmpR family regulator